MIAVDFAPNEKFNDCLLSLRLLIQPWQWQKGNASGRLKNYLLAYFPKKNIFFNLTARSALYNLLWQLGFAKNTEVLIQGYTCEAVVLPVFEAGLKPVYVDIEKKTYSMALEDLKNKINPKCRILILQHTYGFTPQYRQEIIKIVRERKLILIEDLAHGFNLDFDYSLDYKKHFLLLSFGRSKSISSVFGGVIITSDKILTEKLQILEKKLANPSLFFIFRCLFYKPLAWLIKSTYDFGLGKLVHFIEMKVNLVPREIGLQEKKGRFNTGLNKVFPNALAVLAIEQLKKFPQVQKQRLNNTLYYSKNKINLGLSRFPVLVKNKEQLLLQLSRKNIFLGNWYCQPIAPKEFNLKKAGYQAGSCPQAENICTQIINLPTNIDVSQAKKIVNLLSL